MNVCIISMPRSGTEYLFGLLHQLPNISASISEPFHINQIFDINADYVVGARKQLEIIKQLSLTNNLLLKEIYIPDIKIQLPLIWKDGISTNLSENTEVLDIFDEYRTLLEHNFYKIKLVRNNLFDIVLSSYIALEVGQWHNANMDSIKITVHVENFKDLLYRYKLMHDSLINYPGCQETICYENLTGTYSDDCHLIKCITSPINPIKQTMFKNINKQQVIVNYDEIVEVYQQFSKQV